MTKRNDKAPNSTSGRRERTFSKPAGNSTRTPHRRSDADEHGEKKHFSRDSDSASTPRPNHKSNKEHNERHFGGSSNDRPARSFDNREGGERKPFQRSEGGQGGERRFGGSSNDRPARSFDNREGGERKPFQRSEGGQGGERRFGGSSSDRPARSFDSREGGERKPYQRSEGGQGGERRFSGSSNDRPARSFDSRQGGERKPYQRSEGGQGGERRFGGSSNDRPARSYDNREGGERKPYQRSEGGQGGERRFSGSSNDRPARSFDNGEGGERKPYQRSEGGQGGERRFGGSSNDRPARSFDNREGGERKPYQRSEGGQGGERRFGGSSNDRPARSFENNREGGDNRSFRKREGEQGGERRFGNERRDNDRPSGLKPRRRDINGESEILTEIVASRRETGRLSNKAQVLSLKWEEENMPIRLNKYISNSGICSRRDADKLIESGAIMVNDKVVNELGVKVFPTDIVRFEDRILNREKPVYIILNKPKDYITTTEDEKGRKNVMELIEGACRERVYPVGRLDRNTTGLMIFTNDGEMAKKLTHPKYGIRKIYQVELDKNLSFTDMQTIADGIQLDDTFIKPDEIAYASLESKRIIGIEIHSGQNRVVRRIFESLGYEVEKLDRTVYAGLTKKELPRGRWRFLSREEIGMLKMTVS